LPVDDVSVEVEVEGLRPNGPEVKARIFSMMDGGSSLDLSRVPFNVQYRGSGASFPPFPRL
jgi:hypothetical protein